ncbi:MAG: hypothetical protein ACFWUI_00995 [Clostridium sp.]|jgi:CHASE3 domain sensor protein
MKQIFIFICVWLTLSTFIGACVLLLIYKIEKRNEQVQEKRQREEDKDNKKILMLRL